jgi:hypothetical protein
MTLDQEEFRGYEQQIGHLQVKKLRGQRTRKNNKRKQTNFKEAKKKKNPFILDDVNES